MGLLIKSIQERPKLDVSYTVVKLVSKEDNKTTTIRVLDACYSLKGDIIDTIEFPSFEGVFAPMYAELVTRYLNLALKMENYIRAGKLC